MQAHSTPGTYRASNAPKDLYDSQAEAALVYAAIVDARRAYDTGVSPADFHDSELGILWRAIGDMLERADPYDGIDFITLADWITTHEATEHHKRLALRITNLQADMVNSNPLLADEYAAIVKKHAQARRTVSSLQAAVQQVYASLNGGGDRAAAAAREAIQAALQAAEPTAGGAMPVKLVSAAEAWEPLPPVEFILENLIIRGALGTLVGAPEVGKTWVLTSLAVCVATGQPWAGLTTTQAPVLIVDEESGENRLRRRLQRTMRGYGLPPGTNPPIHFVSLEGFAFTQPEWVVTLEGLVTQTGAGLVFVDSLIMTKGDADENLPSEMGPVMRSLRGICDRTGAAIILLHHENAGGKQRGTTAIPAALDVSIQLTRPDEKQKGRLKLETIKSRDFPHVTWGLRMDFDDVTDSFRFLYDEPQDSAAQRLGAGETYVIRYLLGFPTLEASKADIEAHADTCTARTAGKALYALATQGLVNRTDDGKQGQPAMYKLTVAGMEVAAKAGLE